MSATRVVFQASEKVRAICAIMHRAGQLPTADTKALSRVVEIPYPTLKTAIQNGRFSPSVEEKLSRACRFDYDHPSWVDETVPEHMRRATMPSGYPGRDTLDHFKTMLNAKWGPASVSFSASQKSYAAFDPHMVRHELSDLGQTTMAGEEIHFFLTAHFEPFHHRSGILFGFRKAAIIVEIECSHGARAKRCLGHPGESALGNAVLCGENLSRLPRWSLECESGGHEVLAGEYSTREALFTLIDHTDGTALISRIDVNIFDRTAIAAEDLDVSANKQAIIEQIFVKELPAAEIRNGWITISRQELVVGRYGQ